uniref:MFS domain-containing protein n=1 Tax=Globodera pallida TaxID=36090 RepID=A0A183BNK8_GLOPA
MSRRARSLFCVSRRRMSAASAAVLGSSVGGAARAKREASLVHALVVIFLEFFSWGLLTVPVINVLAETFPANKFLMNGLILGLKGILSFLSSPLIGALSDVCGRKPFLLLTVFFTCVPIPCLKISAWWYFTLFTLSGLFSVTFSVVLAYVADITERHERTTACGLVSATFAASLVTSPVVGFSPEAVALFIAYVGVLSVFSQTGFLLLITQRYGPKAPITLGLIFQFIQLVWYGLGSAHWMMWGAGLFAALSQTSYPAISAFVSLQTDKELQGTVQGILSGHFSVFFSLKTT